MHHGPVQCHNIYEPSHWNEIHGNPMSIKNEEVPIDLISLTQCQEYLRWEDCEEDRRLIQDGKNAKADYAYNWYCRFELYAHTCHPSHAKAVQLQLWQKPIQCLWPKYTLDSFGFLFLWYNHWTNSSSSTLNLASEILLDIHGHSSFNAVSLFNSGWRHCVDWKFMQTTTLFVKQKVVKHLNKACSYFHTYTTGHYPIHHPILPLKNKVVYTNSLKFWMEFDQM